MSEQKPVQFLQVEEALRLSHRVLEVANRHTDRTALLEELVAVIRSFTGCAAVGIRILDEQGNIPYEAHTGFSRDFYELESPLSIKSDQCMCISVVEGDADPRLPFYTEGGSFYVNGTTRFLDTVSEEEKGQTRNACNQAGYESVALIPIRARDCVLGLVHLADPQENMVSGLAHELNQPLAAIANYAQASCHVVPTLAGENRDQVLDSMNQIAEQADRAGQIIRQLRAFVRRAKGSRVTVELNELIRDVAVEDNGDGLRTEDVERWFEPFYTTKPDGMGLGLSISRSIVEAHGGRLEATPREERGTTFRFTLPIRTGGGQC